MNDNSIIPKFHYESTDFHYTIKKDETESKFDSILKEKWNYAEENGILRYKLNIREWKILPGSYKVLAELNLDRAVNRRAPEDISSMSQPFNPDRFNFTKLSTKEIFLDVGDGSGNDVIAANVSPMGLGHVLFLPERLKCFPQRMRESSLLKVLELLLLSKSQYLRVIFNSLCANASVNHLHCHFYYLEHQMLLEDINLQKLEGPLFALKDFPAQGFCLKLSWFPDRDYKKLGSWAFFVINYLQENEVAHNVYITRAKTNTDDQIYDDIRIYIWARTSSTGVKYTRGFVLAVCELFGHLSVQTKDVYCNLSENEVAQLMTDVTAEAFNSIQQSLKQAIVNKLKKESAYNTIT